MRFGAWYERFPERLDKEEDAYRERGFDFRLDQDLLQQHGIVVFDGVITAGGEDHPLRVVYPSGFPYVRPEVIATAAALPRHQSPVLKNLCLLPNDQVAWNENDTGALMVMQAIALLETHREGPASMAAREVDAPEPVSVWYPYSPGTSFLFLEQPPMTRSGQFGEFEFKVSMNGQPVLQAILTAMRFASKTKGADVPRDWNLPKALIPSFAGETFSGSWIRCDTPPPFLKSNDGNQAGYGEYLKWALAQEKNLSSRLAMQAQKQRGVKTFAFVYPDEGPRRGQFHDNWLVGTESPGLPQPLLLRPFLWTQDELFSRQPSLHGLEGKKVLIVGLGALGASLAAHLARAGVGHLGLADNDFVDAGPLVRQEFDVYDVGFPKTSAVAWRVRRINPGIAVEQFPLMVGGAQVDLSCVSDRQDELVTFADKLNGYDLLISTTGQTSVDCILNEIGAANAIPCVFTWVLNGAWGGRIFRAQPGLACYECFACSWEQFGEPRQDPSEISLFGRGCGFPTFTGTGFDAAAVSSLAARLAVQTLLGGLPGAYPESPFNLINWSSRGPRMEALPMIEQFEVPRQERCRICKMYSR